MSRMYPRPKQPMLEEQVRLFDWAKGCNGCTYMQKKGEMSDDRARARTEKWMAKYVDQVPL